ncbi:MAG: hypothetical protein M0R17_01485 [Candidatus Omnitrophica bacterium]|jgi:hypothetical protein|nr:hypothetical protein [Candidatus Omnitrophota bacterium]
MAIQNRFSSATLQSGLKSMSAELNITKKRAADFLNDLDEVEPKDVVDQELPEDTGPAPKELPEGEGKEPKGKKIKNVEDAKSVLDEAKTDLQNVVDSLDGICGQVEEEEKKASYKRQSDRYAGSIQSLAQAAEKAIQDTDDAMNHWAFLGALKNPANKIQNASLKQVAETLNDVERINQVIERSATRRLATAVPPTGAEFSGDKWPNSKNPSEVEQRAWEGGAAKFHKDRKFEDARPNPAVDNRLNVEDYSRDDKPYVNASFVMVPENRYASYWDITDTASGKRMIADFANAPTNLGQKNENGFRQFASSQYGEKIVNKIMEQEGTKTASSNPVDGIEVARQILNGRYASIKEAREPKVKDKASVRRYYKDAYGDAGYAKKMTAWDEKVEDEKEEKKEKAEEKKEKAEEKAEKKEASEGDAGMDIKYKPADEHPADKNKGEAKKGPGTLSSQDPQVIKAKAYKAVELARIYASIGAIPFTKEAVLNKSREVQKLSDSEYDAKLATLKELPITNESALKSAHIPETETGIVGNTAEGVRDPKSQVKTDDLNNDVKSDAKVSSLVPQFTKSSSEGSRTDFSSLFSTTASRLREKGIMPEKSRIMRPKYRS